MLLAKLRFRLLAGVLACGLSPFSSAAATAPTVIPVDVSSEFTRIDLSKALQALPSGERWLAHLNDELLPFWTTPEALGTPLGNFPTYRCNDGSLVNPADPCLEIRNADPAIVKLSRDYVRSKSRQIFAYGVAYHLTGEEKYLLYARAGAEWLIANALDRKDGGAYSWFEDGRGAPAAAQRTSQDLAYAVTGIAFLHYLTHDPRYLDIVVDLKTHIFKTYYDREWDLLRWVREANADGDTPDQKELVSQLDQVYGYLLWSTLAVEDPRLRAGWERDLKKLSLAMREQFYGDTYGLYWGSVTRTESRDLGTGHTDFGHSIKTLWLTYRVGLLTGDAGLVEFAKPRMYDIIRTAYLPGNGSWARGFKPVAPGSERWTIDPDKEWWSLAELDQTAATLALVDPGFVAILSRTYDYWFKYMVDHQHSEIWHMVSGVDNKPDLSVPKQHSWKNAFHSFEHALIGYLTTQQLHGKPIVLYYAFARKPAPGTVQPYLYFATLESQKAGTPFADAALARYHRTEITFTSLR